MATIPLGNFGQTVAAPKPAVQQSADAMGAQEGRAMEQLGATGTQIATQQMAAETRYQQQEADRAAQTNAARVRTTKLNDLADAQTALSQDVLTGKVPKDKAAEEWQHRSGQILQDATVGLDPRYSGAIQVELDGHVQRGMSGVRQAVTKRNQDDVQANLLTLGEEYQRTAVRDRPKAIAEYFAQLDAMAPDAGWAPDVVAQKKQAFRENTAYTQAFAMVKGASNSIPAIDQAVKALDGDQFSDVDPQKKAALVAQLDAHKTNLLQRQEIAAQRAQRQEEARLNRARSAFEASQARVDAGIPDNPDQIAITSMALAGTPYLDTYKALQNQAREIGGAAARPISTQQAMVDQLNARISQGGTSDALIKQRDQLQKALDASKSAAKTDPMRGALERGIIDQIAPVDMGSIDGFTRSISKRLDQAQVVQTWAGAPVSPLTTEEARQMGAMLGNLPVQQRATALAAIGTQLGPQASAGLAAQIDKDDKGLALAMRFASDKTGAGRPTAELVLRGAQALKEKTIKGEDTLSTDWRAAISKEIGDGRGFASDAARQSVAEAAYFINAGFASEGRLGISPGLGFSTNKADAARAVAFAVRGRMVDHNGVRLPIPETMSEGDFDKHIKNLTAENFKSQVPDGQVLIGGKPLPLDAFLQVLPDAQLTSVGTGAYNVMSGNRIVTNSKRQPIIIKAN